METDTMLAWMFELGTFSLNKAGQKSGFQIPLVKQCTQLPFQQELNVGNLFYVSGHSNLTSVSALERQVGFFW